jgi:diacylglycerol O-acyltransferase / wax synthase
MEYLKVLDAGFLEAEDADPHVSLAIGALAVIAGPKPDYASFVAHLGERLAKVPRLKQVLHTVPFDLDAPSWVEDLAFDVSHHIRRAAVPRPGDDAALFQLTADLMERRLDRDHPLWECWMIEGLGDDQWAILMKIHHCMADGVATTQLLAHLSDDEESVVGDVATAVERPGSSGPPRFPFNPVGLVTGLWRTPFTVSRAAVRTLAGMFEIGAALVRPATRSALSGPVTGMRAYSAACVPLSDVKKVSATFGVTVNDVALAAITDSYRAALLRRGERPGARSLRTLIPVSARSDDALDAVDNRVSFMLACLPVDELDPVEQLRTVHRRLTRAKDSGQRQAGKFVVSATNRVPFVFTAWAVRALTRLPQRTVVTVASTVTGPRRQMRINGQPVVRMLPIVPIALQLRSGVAIVSYADDLTFGITADFDAALDVDELAAGIVRAVTRLASLNSVTQPTKAKAKRAAQHTRLAPHG